MQIYPKKNDHKIDIYFKNDVFLSITQLQKLLFYQHLIIKFKKHEANIILY